MRFATLLLVVLPLSLSFAADGGPPIAGSVRDARKRPCPEARLVGVVKTWDGGFRQTPIEGTADRRGRFEIADAAPAEGKVVVELAAFAEGSAFASAHVTRDAGGELGPIEFRLERASPVTFRFRDPDGEPVAGATVRPDSRKTAGGEEHLVYGVAAGPVTVESGEDGTVTVDWFAKGDAAKVTYAAPGASGKPHEFAVEGSRKETIDFVVGGLPDAEDVADVPAEDLRAGGDAKKRYALIGPVGDAKPPADGWRLLLVLPGGPGGIEFHPFVKRIAKHAAGEGWLVAQLVSVKWRPDQEIVWPTEKNPVPGMKFPTEEYVAAVVADVAKRKKIASGRVYALGWSSSGPPLYATMLGEKPPLDGALIAMSVFRDAWLPPLDRAKGRRFYLLHSPDDTVCRFADAEKAKAALTEAGAAVELATYEGGHGWRGNVYGMIRDGLAWLTK